RRVGPTRLGSSGLGRKAFEASIEKQPAAAYLSRQHFEHVPVRIAEIESASAMTVIDFNVVKATGPAALTNTLGAPPADDSIELRFVDLEGIMVALEIRIVVEIEGQRVIDPQRSEVREGSRVTQAQDAGEKARGRLLIVRRHDRMVEHDCHGHLLQVVPL